MIEEFARLIPDQLKSRSGLVFYSGRYAFSNSSEIYIMGYNPGGDPYEMNAETIEIENEKILKTHPRLFSSYQDASWNNKLPGTHGLQPRILHMLNQLRLDPQKTPSSNLFFVRSRNVKDIRSEAKFLEEMCWPFHKKVIEELGIRVIICFGNDTAKTVRRKLVAHQKVGVFIEQYENRSWKSEAHMNDMGKIVIQVTHPARADWRNPLANPTPLVQAMLKREFGYKNF